MPEWLPVVLVVAAVADSALLIWFLVVLTRICWGVEATAEHVRRMAPNPEAQTASKPAEPDRTATYAAVFVASIVAFLAGFLASSFYNYRP